MESKLTDGMIPPYTECPFRDVCKTACSHLGIHNPDDFFCQVACGFDLIDVLQNMSSDEIQKFLKSSGLLKSQR